MKIFDNYYFTKYNFIKGDKNMNYLVNKKLNNWWNVWENNG